MKKSITFLALAALLAVGIPTIAMADDVPGHPRVNEVDDRLQLQQDRTDAGVAQGQINAKQEARDNATDSRVSQQLSADEAKNGGHITKGEQVQMNNELNRNSNRIYVQRHK